MIRTVDLDMVISLAIFYACGCLFYRNPETGGYYQVIDSSALYSDAARNEIMTGIQISEDSYEACLDACQKRIMKGIRRDA
jgi:hypothetical protein